MAGSTLATTGLIIPTAYMDMISAYEKPLWNQLHQTYANTTNMNDPLQLATSAVHHHLLGTTVVKQSYHIGVRAAPLAEYSQSIPQVNDCCAGMKLCAELDRLNKFTIVLRREPTAIEIRDGVESESLGRFLMEGRSIAYFDGGMLTWCYPESHNQIFHKSYGKSHFAVSEILCGMVLQHIAACWEQDKLFDLLRHDHFWVNFLEEVKHLHAITRVMLT